MTAAKLETAKNCTRDAFKHHLAKTDTSVYVEAVAKERIFAKAAAAEAARELERSAAQRHICQERRAPFERGRRAPTAEPAANATPRPNRTPRDGK